MTYTTRLVPCMQLTIYLFAGRVVHTPHPGSACYGKIVRLGLTEIDASDGGELLGDHGGLHVRGTYANDE